MAELILNNPITEEQWDIITDVDFDHTDKVTFFTKHHKEVEFVKVVRCKDCKHWDGETHSCEKHPSVEPWWETDSCNYGERKDEVDNG